MADKEIPPGTRAIMFCFTTSNGTPRVTFDLVKPEYANKRYAQLEMMAINAVISSKQFGCIHSHKPHFIQ